MRKIKEKFQESRFIPPLIAKNEAQKQALQAFAQKQIVILSGSAGTGKTELMSYWAAKLWREGKLDTVVITRPYQHLGKDYGAVPGSDFEKLLPFVMSMLLKFKRYLGGNVLQAALKNTPDDLLFRDISGINIVPIEKIQGLSFNDRTIVLADELQNATPAQVKALVTRLEDGSQLIIAGDPIQSALPGKNGLRMLIDTLTNIHHQDISVIHFTPDDNCRSGISGWFANIFEQDDRW